jgi:hypothetical protein
MAKKKTAASEAASLMGRRSVKARIEKWGEAEFQRKLQEWGKLGVPRAPGTSKPRKAASDAVFKRGDWCW